jgi:glycosyltransferase involved in cell wall biosynthesis
MSASRNLAVDEARGEYVSYIDGDDVWVPTKLAEQVALLEAHPEAAMVFGPLELWYSWTGEAGDSHRDHLRGVRLDGRPPFADEIVRPLALVPVFLAESSFTPGGFLVRRRVLVEAARSEEDFTANYSDDVVQVKICLEHPVFSSTRSWYRYRMHADSCTEAERREGSTLASRKRFLDWVERYLEEREIRDDPVWKALRRAQQVRHPGVAYLLNFRKRFGELESALAAAGRRFLPASLRRWMWSARQWLFRAGP